MFNSFIAGLLAWKTCASGATAIEYALIAGAVAGTLCVVAVLFEQNSYLDMMAQAANAIVPAAGTAADGADYLANPR